MGKIDGFADNAESACKTTLDMYLDSWKISPKVKNSTRSYDIFSEADFWEILIFNS